MFGIGMPEVVIILIVALLVIGPKKLPSLARSLGKGFREFKKATSDLQSSFDEDDFGNMNSEEPSSEKEETETPPSAGEDSSKSAEGAPPEARLTPETGPSGKEMTTGSEERER